MLEVSGDEVVVRAGERLSAYSGGSVSLSTEDMDVDAGASLAGFAGESASLVTGRAYLEATESLSVHTRATELTMTGDVDFQSAEDVSVSAAGLVGRAAQSIGVSAGEDVVMNVGDDVEIGVGASLSAGFAGGTKTVTGSTAVRSAGEVARRMTWPVAAADGREGNDAVVTIPCHSGDSADTVVALSPSNICTLRVELAED